MPRYQTHLRSQSQLTRSLLLKPPLPSGEKGVLLVQFEYNWFRLLSQIKNWKKFTERYDIIWGTSWSPTDYSLLDGLLARTEGPLFILPSNGEDRAKLKKLDTRLRVAPVLSACDWMDPASFHPKPATARQIDILMVANWAPFKRHFDLFRALSRMPRTLRVMLIGQKEGNHTRDQIRALAKAWGVPQNLEILESLPVENVHQHLADSKVSVILSRREGSCVAATESLFAGCPLGMRVDAHVGALAYVNSETGMLFGVEPLHRELALFVERAAEFRPREWALKNISCHQSLQKLNRFMQEVATARHQPWTQDLAPFCWRPYPVLGPDRAGVEILDACWRQLATEEPVVFSAEGMA
jgi:glycosyltransferase involved in cell wall biosynthesis